MKDREPKEPFLSLYLSRRQLLWVGAGALAGRVISRIIQPDIAGAQALPNEPTLFYPVGINELPIVNTRIGVTTDEEVSRMNYLQSKEDLGDGFTRYSFISLVNDRPNIIITQKGNPSVAVFKRRFLIGTEASVRPHQIEAIYGSPEALTAVPQWYIDDARDRGSGLPPEDHMETQVYARAGVAAVVSRYSFGSQGEVAEIQAFLPTTVEEYVRKWGQGDYKKLTSWPALILLDGLGSSLDTDLPAYSWKIEGTFGRLYPLFSNYPEYGFPEYGYPEIAHFSYRGGSMVGIDGSWFPHSYKPEDTYQSIFESADKLKELVDHLKHSFSPIDLLGYSLGGVVAWQYLLNYVLPADGPHRDNTIRSAMFLNAPLNGIPDASIVNWLQGEDFETHFGNEATSHLAALASTPERQAFTIATNIRSAEFLRDRRGIEILCLTNSDDCLVGSPSAVIPGFGETLDLGRGVFGIPSCDFIGLAPFSPGSDVANIGHNQILTDPRAEARTRRFLETLS